MDFARKRAFSAIFRYSVLQDHFNSQVRAVVLYSVQVMGETLFKSAFLYWGKNIDSSKFNVLESAYQWPLPQMGLQAMINDDDEVLQWPWIALCQFKT